MVNQKLLDFVRVMLKKGVKRSTLKSQLLQKGWPEQEVNSALDIKGSFKILHVVIICILIGFILIGIWKIELCVDCRFKFKLNDGICEVFLLGEKCCNTEDCKCEDNEVCDINLEKSNKKGCYLINCGDNKCDLPETQDNCCTDCGCEHGYYCENNKCSSKCGDSICTSDETIEDCCIDCGCEEGYKCDKEKNECVYIPPELTLETLAGIKQDIVSVTTIYSNKNLTDCGNPICFDIGDCIFSINSLITTRIINKEGNPAKDVILRRKFGDYTDWEEIKFETFDGKTTYMDVWIPTTLTENILNIDQLTKIPAYIKLEYKDESGQIYTKDSTVSIGLKGRNELGHCMTPPIEFITPENPLVKQFVSQVTTISSPETKDEIESALQDIWSGFRRYGLHTMGGTDFIYFPAQTLVSKEGDCDNLAILFSAVLESIGIKTRIVHILTQKKEGHALVEYFDGESWIPFEQTAIHADLENAKEYAQSELDSAQKVSYTDVEEEWKNKGIIPPKRVPVGVDTITVPPP